MSQDDKGPKEPQIPRDSGDAETDYLTPEIPGSTADAEHPEAIGKYKVLDVLGQGGFGVVYLAQQEKPVRRKVAVKVLKLGMDSKQILARFEAEQQAMAMMNHPNITQVFDSGLTERGQPFYVMELVEGIPITEFCDKKKYTIRQRLELVRDVCLGIQHAHQKGIIHRDIKPSNILVSVHEDKPTPKVIDFGIAKALGHELTEKTLHTQAGLAIGTPIYMSPEQTEMSPLSLDTRSDIYSLGVVLYELLIGEPPFNIEGAAQQAIVQLIRMIREEEPAKPSTKIFSLKNTGKISNSRQTTEIKLANELKGDIDWIVLKTLEKEPERRYPSATELSRDIEKHLSNEAVTAGPPSAIYRMKKFIRRNKGGVFAASLILLALLIGVTGTSVGMFQAMEAERKAEQNLVESQIQSIKNHLNLGRFNFFTNRPGIARLHFAKAIEISSILKSPDPSVTSNEYIARSWLGKEFGGGLPISLFHSDRLHSASFSPDSRMIVTASDDNTARIWDAETGEQIGNALVHDDEVLSASFSPDGKRVVTVSWEETARIWDAETGEQMGSALGHDCWDLSASFSPDGRRLVTASADNTARIWDAETGEQIGNALVHNDVVWSASFSPDGRRLVTAGADKTAKIWDAETSEQIGNALVHDGEVRSASFSPDGRRLVTASADNTARIWDAVTGEQIGNDLVHDGGVSSASFTPDGRRLVTTCDDGTTKIWGVSICEAPVDVITLKAEIYSLKTIDPKGNIRRLSKEEWLDRKKRLLELEPDTFVSQDKLIKRTSSFFKQ